MVTWTRRTVLAGLGGGAASLVLPAAANVVRSDRPVPRGAPPAGASRPDLAGASLARIAEAGLDGDIAISLIEAETGRVRFELGARRALPPASVTKAVTAAYAFDHLGPGHRFATQVLATGPVRDGVLAGDLVLAGGGAPGLSSADLADLVAQLRGQGLREVTGRFVVWGGALPAVAEIDPGQPDHLGYNASVSGLNLNYNRVHFEWRRRGEGYELSMDARAGGYVPEVSHSAMRLAGRAAPLYAHEVEAGTGRELWSVARGALGPGGTRWLPVRDSALYAGDVFATLARAEGLSLPGPVKARMPVPGHVLASHVGPALRDVAQGMLRYSNNMTAEALGLSASRARLAARPDSLAESAAAMTVWAGGDLGMAESRFVDHSGLGHRARSTPRDLTRALRRLGPDGALARTLHSYTLRDDDGAELPLRLRAKTGTLNFVSALAGHITPVAGPPLVFAILTGNLARRAAIPPGQEEAPPGSAYWTGRSRDMQFDLVRIWAAAA